LKPNIEKLSIKPLARKQMQRSQLVGIGSRKREPSKVPTRAAMEVHSGRMVQGNLKHVGSAFHEPSGKRKSGSHSGAKSRRVGTPFERSRSASKHGMAFHEPSSAPAETGAKKPKREAEKARLQGNQSGIKRTGG
jgi:hypothetical protein